MEKITKNGKVVGHELSKPFQAWADGGFGYLPRNAVYTGHGRYRMPQTGDLGQGPVNRNHASSLQKDPQRIAGTGNSSNCELSVSFESGTNFGGDPNLKNGPGTIRYKGTNNFGLGFTVTGYAKGGIGRIGNDTNPDNPDGTWILEQWTAAYIEENGRVTADDKDAWLDISKDIPIKAVGDNVSYYDHPGGSERWGINRYNNFLIKVYKGKEYCQVEFHFVQQQLGPGYELHWYKGLRY